MEALRTFELNSGPKKVAGIACPSLSKVQILISYEDSSTEKSVIGLYTVDFSDDSLHIQTISDSFNSPFYIFNSVIESNEILIFGYAKHMRYSDSREYTSTNDFGFIYPFETSRDKCTTDTP